MNRIYQGKVTNVEILKGKDGKPEPFDADPKLARQKWQDALWQHHQLFQDAVNYYLAAFATLIPADCNDEVWMDYRAAIVRSWNCYTGRQGSWNNPFGAACHVCGCAEDASFDTFQRKLLSLTGSKASEEQRFAALKQAFESATDAVQKLTDPDQPVEESLKGKGKDLFGEVLVALCAQRTKLTPRNVKGEQRSIANESTKKVNDGKRLEWADVFYFKTDTSRAAWPREEASAEIKQTLEDLIAALRKRVKKAKTEEQRGKLTDLVNRLAGQKESLATWCNDAASAIPEMKPTRKGSGGYDLKTAMLFALRPDADGFRDAFLLLNQARLKETTTTTIGIDAAYEARMAGGNHSRIFPFFCDLWSGRLNDAKVGQAVWPDFEKQAFIEVFTKIGQFILRERKFELRLDAAERTIERIRKQKETDPRLQAVEHLAADMANGAVDDNGQPRLYSIRERTLKAWPKVRMAWRDLIAKRPDTTAEMLLKEKNRLQERNREKFGSAALFDRLAEQRDIWNHTDEDPLRTWAAYVEAVEEKAHLESERLFAPAHRVHSPRFFRWSETNNKEHLPTNSDGAPFRFEADGLDLVAKKKTKLLIHFRSPRLLRDSLRKAGEKLNKDEPDQEWLPPVLRAFVKSRNWPCDKQTFAGASVRLAPPSEDNIQLVFEPELTATVLAKKWGEEFPFTPLRAKIENEWVDVGLRWPKSEAERLPWFERGEVKCLAVDLGLTNSAAWQVLQATIGDSSPVKQRLRHRLNPDAASPAWYAASLANGITRVAGENRWVFRRINEQDRKSGDRGVKKALEEAGANGTHAFLPELSGSAGRNATPEETDEAAQLFAKFKTRGYDIDERRPDWKVCRSFPEQNDDLLWGMKRVRGQLFRLNRLAEQFSTDHESNPFQSALATVEKLRKGDPLLELKAFSHDIATLRERIGKLAGDYLACFRDVLPQVADRILPVRRGQWDWRARDDGWHEMQLDRSKPRQDALLAGQRGISLARLSQLRDLRQLAQSLNHLCRHKAGERYQIRFGELVPEPFEDCRQALEDARKDRAKQIAHEIFAAALGVELAPPPADKKDRRRTESLHGVYRCLDRGPVNFIVLENLVRYRTSAKQGRRENRQLAAWAHRQIHKILRELCELVGMPIVLAPPEWTSHFSAKDHSAGFRAEEVRRNDPRLAFWREKAEEDSTSWWAEFVPMLDRLPEKASLLLPKRGGEVFVPLKDGSPLHNADLNAAYRLGLRALSHRDRSELIGTHWVKKKPYLVDVAGVLPGSTLRDGILTNTKSERTWEYVYEKLAWHRCREINRSRLKDWGVVVETKPVGVCLDEEDNIPY
jgi:hypothetical protein